jgi:hypothetical protein
MTNDQMESYMRSVTPKERDRTVAEASESSLAHLLAQHGMRVLSRRVNDALRPVGITSAQFCLLSFLYQRNPPTVKELAKKIKMHRMYVSAQVSFLSLFSIFSGLVGGSSTGASPAKRILDAR